ncbi:MAG: hypothetical protein ACYC3I_11945 [Gemmataceae bacterium]
MDQRLHLCLWMVGGWGFGSILGSAFGALTAALYARNGGAAGTRLARNTVENFLQAGDRQPSPTWHAALIGAADGFFFLGGLGLVAGTILGKSGQSADELLLMIGVGSVLLFVAAIFFGTMAYALTYQGAQFLYIFAGGLLGSLLASVLFGSVYGAAGAGAGPIIGLYLCRAVRGYSPKFHSPRVDYSKPQRRSDNRTDITGPPLPPLREDIFRKLE